jgi:hypothetical protein
LDSSLSYGFEEPRHPEPGGVPRVLRLGERDENVTLRREVVDLVRLDLPDQSGQLGPVGKVSIVKEETDIRFVGVLVDVIDSVCIERGCPTDDPVYFILQVEQELGQIGPILPGDSCDQRPPHGF